MMKRITTVTVLLLLVLASGCTTLPAPSAFSLKILHTNDTWGYTEPCG